MMKNIYLLKFFVLALLATVAIDSAAARYRIIARTDTVNIAIKVDSIALKADSLSVQADSLSVQAADSTSVTKNDSVNVIPDSLIIGYMPDSIACRFFKVNERSKREVEMLKMLYKKGFDGVTPPSAVYDKWRIAFTSTADRSLDMYIDGMCILLSCVETDTIINKRYDRLSRYRNELMELYDLAVDNIEQLNRQIDRENTKDTLTVAKLRGMQLKYYSDLTIADSTYNSDSLFSKAEWQNRIYLDRRHEMFMYPRYKEIILSNDLNIDMTYLTFFIKAAEIKIGLDREMGLSRNTRQENFTRDCELAKARADEILAWVDPYEMYNQEHTIYEVFSSQLITMDEIIRAGNRRFISNNDFPKLEEYYTEKLQKEGEDVYDEILSSPLENYSKSKIYIDVLRRKYDIGPTYDLACKIRDRYLKKVGDSLHTKQDVNDAIAYSRRVVEKHPEDFSKETKYSQAIQYSTIASLYEKIGKRFTDRIKYIRKAQNVCPDYPDAYFQEAHLICEYGDAVSKNRYTVGLFFCIAYERCTIALEKLNKLKANQNPEFESYLRNSENISKREKGFKSYIDVCEKNFPDKSEAFMRGIDEKESQKIQVMKCQLGTYKYRLRFSE